MIRLYHCGKRSFLFSGTRARSNLIIVSFVQKENITIEIVKTQDFMHTLTQTLEIT